MAPYFILIICSTSIRIKLFEFVSFCYDSILFGFILLTFRMTSDIPFIAIFAAINNAHGSSFFQKNILNKTIIISIDPATSHPSDRWSSLPKYLNILLKLNHNAVYAKITNSIVNIMFISSSLYLK